MDDVDDADDAAAAAGTWMKRDALAVINAASVAASSVQLPMACCCCCVAGDDDEGVLVLLFRAQYRNHCCGGAGLAQPMIWTMLLMTLLFVVHDAARVVNDAVMQRMHFAEQPIFCAVQSGALSSSSLPPLLLWQTTVAAAKAAVLAFAGYGCEANGLACRQIVVDCVTDDDDGAGCCAHYAADSETTQQRQIEMATAEC